MSRKAAIVLFVVTTSCLLGPATRAGDPCRRSSSWGAGAEYPCGDFGCGPRYWGAVFEEVPWRDQCDCQGNRTDVPQGTDLLAPWQLPSCRGFTSPRHLGYGPTSGVCDNPGKCHPCTKGSVLGFRPGPLWWF